ncbi:hypothetical protein L1286_20985 [Pseudoalteromonas sp. SMS1]|uniref:hypothetical protein n=1 Tax=Pseudoalteromonas sp. SMS1 TaxID=2908894 RepID=UPI001F26F8D3|nr:hypothetical protein [Pseudoalteromonas sp. SMS1]MCF2859961.1 hypothetical protein [Pseudoalteromonas sp. SMS1]
MKRISSKILFHLLILLGVVPIAACEGSKKDQNIIQQPTPMQRENDTEYTNLMLSEPNYVIGACVKTGYPTLRDSQVFSEQESNACLRNQSHRYDADALASDTQLHWRVKVNTREFQCTCAGYVKNLSPAK